MHGNVPAGAGSAIVSDGTFAAEVSTDGTSAVDDENWFSEAAQGIYEHKPGTQLHQITTLGDERLCQRYAAGHVKPPAYFLRALLRGKHGRQWLRATMAGCQEQWWLDFQRAAEVGRDVIARVERK